MVFHCSGALAWRAAFSKTNFRMGAIETTISLMKLIGIPFGPELPDCLKPRIAVVIVVSIDMSAVFDLLDKEIILPCTMKLGVPDNLIQIYEDFLSERKGFIQCGQSASAEFDITVGCIQGSPSGPYLFTLLVDGIQEYMPDVNIIAYADDMYYVFESDSWDSVAKIASEKTKEAIEWLKNLAWLSMPQKQRLHILHPRSC